MGDQLEKVNLEEINLGAFLFMVGGSKLLLLLGILITKVTCGNNSLTNCIKYVNHLCQHRAQECLSEPRYGHPFFT